MRVLALFSVLLLAACSGEMTGQVRGTGERVQFSFEEGMTHDNYTAVIGGETFVGKAVMDGAATTHGTVLDGSFAQVLGTTTTNRFVATLLGNRGNTLTCQMRYASSDGMTTLGGVGVCKHSDGRTIDVVW